MIFLPMALVRRIELGDNNPMNVNQYQNSVEWDIMMSTGSIVLRYFVK